MHAPEHDWRIVAPWWRWPGLPGRVDTVAGRLTRPAIQKYETSDLVNEFLRAPQRCLRFGPDDVVPTYGKRYVPYRTIGGVRKAREVIDRNAPIEIDPADGKSKFAVAARVRSASGLRKLYLDTHKRFYLVVCQLHCDAPGFPKVRRERICEAGFVVRRRTTRPPAEAVDEGRALLKGIARQRMRLEKLDATLPRMEVEARQRRAAGGVRLVDARLDAAVRRRGFTLALLQQEQERLGQWARRFDVAPTLQGWFRRQGLAQVGQWQLVEETPGSLGEESSFPLYPLVPDENDRRHAGHFGTIWFGVVPTGLADHEPSGTARFREQEYYEIRCWARRHHEPHDRGAPCRCPAELHWSTPTEPYWIAGHYDLVGTSQRPVTVQLPDLRDLAADPRPRHGATFSKPPGSLAFSVADQKAANPGSTSGFQICTLPIPLITLIAMFVLELFLPVVVFLFGLFWMLLLKFCIPPEIDVGGGLTAELAATPGGMKLDASGKIDVALTTDAAEDAIQLTEAWAGAPSAGAKVAGDAYVKDLLDAQYPPAASAELRARFTTAAILNWQMDYQASGTTRIPSVTDELEFEPEHEHP
jgi:hypothetical protein